MGRIIVNTTPSPGLLSTFNSPPCAFTMSYAKLNPNPVPCPVGLVVKKGWKILSTMWAGMPELFWFT